MKEERISADSFNRHVRKRIADEEQSKKTLVAKRLDSANRATKEQAVLQAALELREVARKVYGRPLKEILKK